MSSLSERVAAAQKDYVEVRDRLNDHLSHLDDTNITDKDLEISETLNADLARKKKTIEMLEASERNMATTSKDANGRGVILHSGNGGDPINGSSSGDDLVARLTKSKNQKPLDCMIRAGVVAYMSKVFQRVPEEMRTRIANNGFPLYGEESVKAATELFVQRAATVPAQTTVTGWAAELVQTVWAPFMELLLPKSIYPRLAARGLSLSFGRAGRIIIPTRNGTPTISGSFVGEGLPIPVRQGQFSAITLTPKKMAVISTWTRELDEFSIPAIEGLLREAIGQDTAIALDSVLIDANPATAIRPPGLLNGVTPLTATAGGGVAAIVGDFKGLFNALVTATRGNVRDPVYLMNPGDVNSLLWTPALAAGVATGVFPFRDEVKAGNIGGVPIIDSGTVPLHSVTIVDAADFVSVGSEAPRFDVSDVATLHEEDTAPLPIVGGGGTAAAPVRSLWQTDSLALRLIHMMNWTMRRAGMVASVSGITWG